MTYKEQGFRAVYRQFIAMAPLFGFYDSAGETRQMCKFKIPLKTQQVLLHKAKQVPWGHRRRGRECTFQVRGLCPEMA